MKRPILFLALVAGAAAQPVNFGVKGGVRLANDSQSRPYAVGPMLTAGLPLGFRIEFNALYRREGDFTQYGTIHFVFVQQERGNSWEFPVLLRRTLWRGVYGGLGLAPRVVSGTAHIISYGYFPVHYEEYDATASWQNAVAFIASGGIERRIGPLRVAPEVRYSHWNQPLNGALGGSQDHVDVMLGITFP
jgi:hypothetical protein